MRVALLSVLLATAPAFAANAVYDSTCGLCHQSAGAGLKGQFPRLAGRVDQMASHPAAREFVIRTILYGMAGRIEVDGAPIVGVMPSFASLSDADLASVLSYLAALGGAQKLEPFTAKEVAAVRKGPGLSAAQVLEERKALAATGHIP
jgi:mono/diheme cytochrome c family protein